MTKGELLGQLYADPKIAEELNGASTETEMREKLSAHGLEFEEAEFHQLIVELQDSVALQMEESGELSEDMLDNVAGGVFSITIPTILTVTATGAAGTAMAIGLGAGVVVAGAACLGYWAYKRFRR